MGKGRQQERAEGVLDSNEAIKASSDSALAAVTPQSNCKLGERGSGLYTPALVSCCIGQLLNTADSGRGSDLGQVSLFLERDSANSQAVGSQPP